MRIRDLAFAWQRYEEAFAWHPDRQSFPQRLEECGMRWLREIRVRDGKQTFTDVVNSIPPVLAERAASAAWTARGQPPRQHGLGGFPAPARRDWTVSALLQSSAAEWSIVFADAMLGHDIMAIHRGGDRCSPQRQADPCAETR